MQTSRPILISIAMLLAAALVSCSPSDADLVGACFDHVKSDPKSVELMPGLPDSTLKSLETNAEQDGDGYVAVGKAKSEGGVIEFGCEMNADGEVLSSRVGPKGSLDTN